MPCTLSNRLPGVTRSLLGLVIPWHGVLSVVERRPFRKAIPKLRAKSGVGQVASGETSTMREKDEMEEVERTDRTIGRRTVLAHRCPCHRNFRFPGNEARSAEVTVLLIEPSSFGITAARNYCFLSFPYSLSVLSLLMLVEPKYLLLFLFNVAILVP